MSRDSMLVGGSRGCALAIAVAWFSSVGCATSPPPASETVEARWPAQTTYREVSVNGRRIFVRQAGDVTNPTLVLLHGYPSSSHTYRLLIPLLSGHFHVVAPDHLGSGYSDKPDPTETEYTFDLLADYVLGALDELGIDRFALYMQDFGAPVGFRILTRHPERVSAIVLQNANAYLEGIPEAKQRFFVQAQTDRSPENVEKLYAFTGPDAIREQQYLRDVEDHPEIMSPDTWTMDSRHLEDEPSRRIQVELFQDYKTNLDRYPQWQALLREHQFPALIAWGRHDPVFTEAGARAYLRDLPDAELNLLDAGHFAAEERPVEIAQLIVAFMKRMELNDENQD